MSTSIDSFITGQSSAMVALKNMITMVAPSSTTVLVLGETGTGKEMVSRAIHQSSGRPTLQSGDRPEPNRQA